MDDNKKNGNDADRTSGQQQSGKWTQDWEKYVVGGFFLLFAILLLIAIFVFKKG